MRLNFEISSNDYFDFQWYITRTSLLNKFIRLALSAFIFMLTYTLINIAGYNNSYSLLTAGIMALIGFVFFPILQRKHLRKKVLSTYQKRQNTTLFGSKTIYIDEDGIRESTTFLENKASWSEVKEIVETTSQFFIILNSMNAFIIPVINNEEKINIITEINNHAENIIISKVR